MSREKSDWENMLADTHNQSILKEISPGISLEGMMLKLKFQYFGPLGHSIGSKKYPVRLERRAESFASLETRPDSPGEFGMQPRDPCRPWSGTLCPRHKPR